MAGVWAYLSKFKGTRKSTRYLLVATLVGSIPVGISSVAQSLFLQSLGYSPSDVGLLLGSMSFTGSVFMIPGSIMADFLGRRKMLIASSVAYAIYLVMFVISTNFTFLLLAVLLSGFAWGTYSAPSTALLAQSEEAKNRNYVFSFSSLLFNTAIIIGNLLSGLVDALGIFHIAPDTSYKILFLIGSILSLASVFPLLMLSEKVEAISIRKTKVLRIESWKIVTKFSAVSFVTGFGAGFFIAFLSLYLRMRYFVSDSLIGTALAMSNAVIGISFLVSPALVGKIGEERTILITQGLSIIPLLMILFPIEFYSFVFIYSVRAVLMNMASPILTSYTMNMTKESERASVSGITSTAWAAGNATSSFFAGYIMNASLDLPVYFCSISYVVATILFYLFFRKAKQQDAIQSS